MEMKLLHSREREKLFFTHEKWLRILLSCHDSKEVKKELWRQTDWLADWLVIASADFCSSEWNCSLSIFFFSPRSTLSWKLVQENLWKCMARNMCVVHGPGRVHELSPISGEEEKRGFKSPRIQRHKLQTNSRKVGVQKKWGTQCS